MKEIIEKRAATIRGKMERSIRDAIQRLEARAPKHPALKKAVAAGQTVPITQSNVCVEAGKSRSALHRSHPTLLAEIRAAAGRQGKSFGPTMTSRLHDSAVEVRRLESAQDESSSMIASLELKVLSLTTRLEDEIRKSGRAPSNVTQFQPA